MLIDRPRLQVLIADRDVSERCDSLTFSATDNGGYEIATLGLPAADRPKKGATVTIRQGLEVAWAGRVAEIADHSQHDRATKTTGCEGLRALLRDTLVQMVYVDRDLTQWAPPVPTREINLAGAANTLGSFHVGPDPAGGDPALTTDINGPWTGANGFRSEAYYDAGAGNLAAKIFYTYLPNSNLDPANANWQGEIWSTPDEVSFPENSGALRSAGASGYWAPTVAQRLLLIQLAYAIAGGASVTYAVQWSNLAVYGTHGLTGRGPDPVGFYPSDIAQHALSQCSNVSAGAIIAAIGYICPHVVYRTPTPADQIIDDMAKLMGWTWGVWEPSTILGIQPRLDFRPPPSDATCAVTKAECNQLDITSRLGDLYNVCQVTYTDPAGSVGMATVTLANAQLSEAGIATRTLPLNMGPGSQATATAVGSFALALSQIAARAAGQATLPSTVRLIGGGSKPAVLLRPGLDRLRIVDLVDGGPLLDIGTVRRDVFRVSRVETTVGPDGIPSTRVELDSGSNLLETLQARLAIAAGVVGSGASGG